MSAPRAGPTSTALVRMRIALLFLAFLIVGVTACGIFDRWEWMVIAAPVLPTVGAITLVPRPATVRVLTAIIAVIATTALATLAAGGSVGEIADAFTSGFQGVLSTEWPSPDRPDLIGTVALVIAAATALANELATRRRFHLLPLLPMLATYVLAVALSSPLGVRWAPLVGIGATSTLFLLFRADGGLRERAVMLRGERRLVPLILVVVAIGALLTVPITLTARADPRRNDPPERTAPILDPIESTLALRDLDPPVDLHRVTPADDAPLPTQWRTAALSDYDGEVWTPELALRPIGRTLGPITGPTVAADISFLDDVLSLVPLPGPPVSVDAAVETDADRTVVRLLERPVVGEVVPVVANTSATINELGAASVAGRVVDDDVSTLTELAEGLAESGSPLDQLGRLASVMRNDFVLDNQVQGGGLQRLFIELFLRDTQRGNTEQFVTSYVLLARSLGYEARVATGFVAGSNERSPDGALSLSSADATVWPEVQLTDGRWLAFDPVPEDEASDQAPPPPEPQTQTPAAPQPPIAPPPDPDNESEPIEEPEVTDDTGALSAAITWGLRGAAGLAAILLPIVIAACLILGAKYRRRKRRLHAPAATDRIRGAWATATDSLVDAGMSIGRSSTDAEIADTAEPFVAEAHRDLHRLATLSSAATYGTPAHEDRLADDAVHCLDSVERSMGEGRTRRQRLRWRLSLRSLRSTTRSPVAD